MVMQRATRFILIFAAICSLAFANDRPIIGVMTQVRQRV